MITPIAIWKVTTEEEPRIQPAGIQASTLDGATQQLPEGGYTTFRTFGGARVVRLEEHFERLEESARLMGKAVKLPRGAVRAGLRQALAVFPAPERRVRMVLDLKERPGDVYLLVEELKVPSQDDYEQGVRAVTRIMRRENPKAKQTAFIETAASVRRELLPGINEAIMVDPGGRLLEGLSSNVFVVSGGTVWTAEEGVLAGITREVVLECIREKGLPLVKEGFPSERLGEAQEVFITSASRAVLPVTEIDGNPVGGGRPGPITLALLAAYQANIESGLEEV